MIKGVIRSKEDLMDMVHEVGILPKPLKKSD